MALKVYAAVVDKVDPEKIKDIKGSTAEPFMRLAVTLPSLRKLTSKKLEDAVTKSCYGVKMKESMPLVIPSRSTPGAVTVYPNIRANWSTDQVAEYITGILKDERAKVRLETPERSAKLALKKETTTLAKVLAEHTNLKERGYRDDQIRDKADSISALFGKMEFKECKTPEDCYTAYKTKNGSCMTVGSTYFGDWTSKTWIEIADDTGFYPSAWYLYQPYAKLCYLEAGGIPVARYMLYRTDVTKDEWPFWGDCKYVSAAFYEAVRLEMENKQGKKAKGITETVAPYRVPALFHPALKEGKVPHCPLPFADSQAADWSVWYDSETKEFHFEKTKDRKGGLSVRNNYDHQGYICGDAVPELNPKEEPNPEPVEEKAVEAPPVKEAKPQARKKVPVIGAVAVEAVKEVKAKSVRKAAELMPVKPTKAEAAVQVTDYSEFVELVQ